MNTELEMVWKKAVMAYVGIWLEGFGKSTKILSG
jgi:hypothetical protein